MHFQKHYISFVTNNAQVIAYYSTQIFMDGGFTEPQALLVSLGTGIVNWLFAIPAIYTVSGSQHLSSTMRD